MPVPLTNPQHIHIQRGEMPLPFKDLSHLVLVEDKAGVVVPQHSHDAQAQAGGIAANKVGGFQQQFCLHHAQFIQQLHPMTEKPFNSHRGKVWSEREEAHQTHSLQDLPGKALPGTFCLGMHPRTAGKMSQAVQGAVRA